MFISLWFVSVSPCCHCATKIFTFADSWDFLFASTSTQLKLTRLPGIQTFPMGCEKVLDICKPWTLLTNTSTTVIATYCISCRAIAHPSWWRGMTAVLAAERSTAWHIWKANKVLQKHTYYQYNNFLPY